MPYSTDGNYIPDSPDDIRQSIIDTFNQLYGTSYNEQSWRSTNNHLMTECCVQAIVEAEQRYSLAYSRLANYIKNTEKTLLPLSTNDSIRLRMKELGFDVYIGEEPLNGGNAKIFVSPEDFDQVSFENALRVTIKERWPAGVTAIQNLASDPSVVITLSNGQDIQYWYLVAVEEPVEIEIDIYTSIQGGSDLPSIEDIKNQVVDAFNNSYRLNPKYYLQEIVNVGSMPFARSITVTGKPKASAGEFDSIILSESLSGGALMKLDISDIKVSIISGF